jgi:TrmH family RNA methyltransferase
VAEGFHLFEEARHSGVEIAAVVAADSALSETCRLLDQGRYGRPAIRLVSLSDALFQEICATENSQGLITLVRPPEFAEDDLFVGTPLILVLDAIQDPGNAGTLVRAAEAFGSAGALFLKGTVSPWNPKTLRASAGSLFRLPLLTGFTPADAVALFERRRVPLLVTVPQGGLGPAFCDLTEPCAIVLGSEAHGVSEAFRFEFKQLTIAMHGVESLNAGVAGSIILYEADRQRSNR